MKFEWDLEKATSNLAAHGVSFELAAATFTDTNLLEEIDDREEYYEDRWVLIGQAQGVLLTVVYTERGEANRIISARRATKDEQDRYFCANSI